MNLFLPVEYIANADGIERIINRIAIINLLIKKTFKALRSDEI